MRSSWLVFTCTNGGFTMSDLTVYPPPVGRVTTESVRLFILHTFGVETEVAVYPDDPTSFIVTPIPRPRPIDFTITINVEDVPDAHE